MLAPTAFQVVPEDDIRLVTEVAVTGSPNTVTTLEFDVRATHLQSPLLGTLLALEVPVRIGQTSDSLLVLGQVASIETQNRWHEEPGLKNYIKLRGRLPHLTEIGDITTGTLQIIGAYRRLPDGSQDRLEKTRLSVPPGSGVGLRQVDSGMIEQIMAGDFGFGYLGYLYGATGVVAPVYIRHFGDFDAKGSGEAYMGGVFGPSGSGKSVLAASLIALWSHQPEMGILLLDPQSEFSENLLGGQTGFSFDFHELLEHASSGRFRRQEHVITLDQLRLEGPEIFVEVLREKQFFQRLGCGDGKVNDVVDLITRFLSDLTDKGSWSPSQPWGVVDAIVLEDGQQFKSGFTSAVALAYAAAGRAQKAKEFLDAWQSAQGTLGTLWNESAAFFNELDENGRSRVSIESVLRGSLLEGNIRILDLNPQRLGMSQAFKLYLVDFVFKRLRGISHQVYRKKTPGNCLVVLDEAGRFVPQDAGDNERLRALARKVTDSVKELRKMRCGFMFITQSIAEIQKEIYRNLHFRIYGVGLGVGADGQHIRDREGEEAFELYRSLPDPRLSRTFSYMVSGILLALGSTGKPLVIEGFPSGDSFLANNGHIFRSDDFDLGPLVAEDVDDIPF